MANGAKRLRLWKNFARSNDAATAVEFAIVAAPFLALLIALFQSALVFLAERVLDETVEQASRTIMTGHAQSGGTNQAGFATWVCSNTSGLFDCNNFMINVKSYSSFGSA